ncbi:hypothetical protein [Amantichitinum ursilacus]|uniref:Autotransporter domain-containing protein n=1 Tax=Amantichitinum ursilacus TaxID=857265 RepID=A0A0N0XGZ2_9NEIS|nr:hypothetical protein [Amantichitinum ursilacus]KPC50651.1 hypothetical protein WG78_16395 [Amantichitinum ursilacus]
MSRFFALRRAAIAGMVGLATSAAHAAPFEVLDRNIQRRANGVVAMMGYSVVPDVTTSSLSINSAESGNPGLWSTQLGGGATMYDSFPVYLEGMLGYTRYDPTFVASNGSENRFLPLRWNTLNVSAGIGWDFFITPKLRLRPILNASVGKVASDIRVADWAVEGYTGRDFSFLDGGTMNVYGLGGSMMLVYEDFTPAYEYELELRYANIPMHSFGGELHGEATAQSFGLWTRYRAPTGWQLMDRPVRYVLELAHTEYLGQLRGALGFNDLTSLGAGIEFDSSKYHVIVTRTRLVARYVFGNNVHGASLGLAVSF